MYTVIGTAATRAFRVIWMLEELGQPYEVIDAAPRSPEITAHNPDGKVPALVIEGEVLVDSVAIVQFLADRHGMLTYPAGTLDRAKQDSHTQFCVDEIEGALWTTAKNSFVHPEEHRTPEIKTTCRYEFDMAMKRLEQRLGDGPYVMGETFSVPDVIIGHCAGWASRAKFDIPDGPVTDYFGRITARPAFQRANALRQT